MLPAGGGREAGNGAGGGSSSLEAVSLRGVSAVTAVGLCSMVRGCGSLRSELSAAHRTKARARKRARILRLLLDIGSLCIPPPSSPSVVLSLSLSRALSHPFLRMASSCTALCLSELDKAGDSFFAQVSLFLRLATAHARARAHTHTGARAHTHTHTHTANSKLLIEHNSLPDERSGRSTLPLQPLDDSVHIRAHIHHTYTHAHTHAQRRRRSSPGALQQ